MSSHPIVRRLTTAVLLLMLAAAPALAASGRPAHRPHAPQAPVLTGVPLLDHLLGWLGFPAAGPRPDVRGTHEKSGPGLLPPGLNGPLDLLQGGEQERGGMIDPNG